MSTLDDSVMDFVADFTGANRQRLTLTTTLVDDLGINGDDGLELFEAFGEKFQVDLSAFRADKYFNREGLSPIEVFGFLCWLISWPFRKGPTLREFMGDSLRDIRICDLISAAKEKKWTL